ncbi:hypothetical protein P4234_12850 [Pseudomonas aeruginosa]|nr:hypothetical protein [Pseudomonas aeruginosa]
MDDYERGTMKLGDFVSAAKGARNGLSLLNDSDMRQLESAIEAANQKIQQLKEGSKSTLVSLREELAGLRGEQEAVDRSRFNSRKAELQQQLAEAQGSGDMNAVQNLMTALATLQQIQAETDAKRQREEQQKRVDEQNAAKAAAAPPASSPASSPPPRVVRFETPRGAVDVAVASEQDETNLLGVLEQASRGPADEARCGGTGRPVRMGGRVHLGCGGTRAGTLLTGALLVQEGTKLHGRPITLRSGEGYGRRCGSCANWRCCATSACGSCRWCCQTAANSR